MIQEEKKEILDMIEEEEQKIAWAEEEAEKYEEDLKSRGITFLEELPHSQKITAAMEEIVRAHVAVDPTNEQAKEMILEKQAMVEELALLTEKKDSQTDEKTVADEIKLLKKKYQSLGAEFLDKKLEGLKAMKDELQADYKFESGKLKDLNSEYIELMKQNTEYKHQISVLEEETIETLQFEKETLNDCHSGYINALKIGISEQKDIVSDAQIEITANKKKIKEITKEHDRLNGIIERSKGSFQNVEDYVENLTEEFKKVNEDR